MSTYQPLQDPHNPKRHVQNGLILLDKGPTPIGTICLNALLTSDRHVERKPFSWKIISLHMPTFQSPTPGIYFLFNLEEEHPL